MDCGALNIWFEQDPSKVGVALHGRGAWDFVDMRSRIGLEYEVITDMPEAENDLYPDMLALMKGMADINIDQWGVNYERSKLIDFTYPNDFEGIYIFSGAKKAFIHADLVMGAFDNVSYSFLFLALVAMVLVCWIVLAKEDREHSVFTCFIYILGSAVNQPLSLSVVPKAFLGLSIMTFFSFYNNVICLMYRSVIISLVISGSKPPKINSLEDLNKTENLNTRIIMEEGSYIPEFLDSTNMLVGFRDRIDYIDTYNDRNMLRYVIESVLGGSHVSINSHSNFEYDLCHTNSDANMTIANLEDFQTSRLASISNK